MARVPFCAGASGRAATTLARTSRLELGLGIRSSLGLRFLHSQGRCKFAGGNASNPPPKNFGNHNGGVTRAIDAKIGELIRRETLRMERAEAGLVAEERPAGHRHATGEKNVDRSV